MIQIITFQVETQNLAKSTHFEKIIFFNND
jgi:hypothetical protein